MSEFLLVHGAMHGAWCWRDVEPLLRAAGHGVSTLALTGQGERAHLLTPEVGVETHIEDIVAVAEFADLEEVILVLHSYSGILAGPLAQRLGDRLRAVIAAGAFLVDPGQSLLDVEPPEVAQRYRDLAAEAGDGWRVPASTAFLDQWGVADPRLRDLIGPRLTDFPYRCATDPVLFDPDYLNRLPRTYLEHTAPPLISLAGSIEQAQRQGWTHRSLATGHDLMLTDPHGTARLLLDAV